MKYESSSARPRRLFQNGKSIPTPRAVSVSCKSCICHACGNCPGCGDTLPVLEESARSRRRGLVFHSSSFFSHSCALFCTLQNSTLFFSSDCALFVQKHPGWGYLSPFKSPTS